MKHINEMTLDYVAERLDGALNAPILAQVLRHEIGVLRATANFIAERSSTLELELQELKELTRWFPVCESYPSEGDTVLCWRVATTKTGTKVIKPKIATFRNGRFDCEVGWVRVTKWQRITPPTF